MGKHIFRRFLLCLALLGVLSVTSCNETQRPLEFPFDHGPHFDSRNEWWYFTGVVSTAEGKTLGFEVTLFKRWVDKRGDFAYLGHIAVSDPATGEHLFSESKTSPPVPGIQEGRSELEINGFSYRVSESGAIAVTGIGSGFAADLTLTPTAEVVPHGQDGIIVMGDGTTSYYYSYTNLATTGSIVVNGVYYAVASGRTWMDHQWGNFTVFGMRWDWFSLRLDDGGSVMLFRFRNALDAPVRSSWTYAAADGTITYGEQLSVEASRTFIADDGNCAYPLDWKIEAPDLDGAFTVKPLFDDQALSNVMTPEYWEGLCSVEGQIAGKQVQGSSYVELTGYCR